MTKKYFTEKEAIEKIIDTLGFFEGYSDDLHHVAFNTNYYIIGTYEAKKALEQYGTFEAIEEIKQYEMGNFGEVYTDFSSPEKVANMLWYIIGEKVINELDVYDVNYIDNENRQKIIERLKRRL